MNSKKKVIQTGVIITNIVGLLFYYSPISLYGYWSDTFLLLAIIIGTFFLLKQVESKLLKIALKTLSVINFIIVSYTAFSIFHGIIPVHFIPIGHCHEKDTYAYFIERWNLGLTNGCYGEIQYHKQISWLPFLEIRIETVGCSTLDYDNIIKGA